MSRYKRKPDKTVVEAIQWFPGVEIKGVTEDRPLEAWLEPDSSDCPSEDMFYGASITPGDWVVTNIPSGSTYCEPDASFQARWELDV